MAGGGTGAPAPARPRLLVPPPPPAPDSPLLTAPNTLFSPHMAGVTEAALRRMGMEAAAAVIAFRDGRLDPALRLA